MPVSVTLLASYSGVLGGAERALLQFSTALDGERWLACPEGPLATAGRAVGIRVATIPQRRLELRGGARERAGAVLALAAHGSELRALARDLNPDLLIACGMRSMLSVSLSGRRSRTPTVFLHNDLLPGAVIAEAVRRAAACADLVIVPSRAVAADLDRPATIVAPGVADAFFQVSGAPVDPAEILVLGALVPWKRHDLALEAAALARREHPELTLRIAGGRIGEEGDGVLAALEARIARADLAGHVELLGRVDDPAAALERCVGLLHCAEREPFGIAVAEALAAGRPAVVPRDSSPAEIVGDTTGLTFAPGDAAGAAAAIGALLSDRARAAQLGADGRTRAAEHFSEAAAQERFIQALATLGADRAPERPVARDAGAVWTIVTVTHNSADALEGLLSSVATHAPGTEVIVVDNASSDDTLATCARWAERLSLRTLALAENLGFGTAVNRGVALARTPVVALLNPDVELLDGSVDALAARVAARPAGAPELLGPLVLSADGRRQDSAHPAPGSAADRLHAVLPPSLVPAGLAARLAPWRSPTEVRVGWLVGAAIVARTDTLRELGPFDPDMFLYGEDLDLSLRVRARGGQARFCPEARLLHHGAHTSRRRFGGEPFALLARARHDAIAANLGARAAGADNRRQALTFASRAALKTLLRRPRDRERAQLAAVRGLRS